VPKKRGPKTDVLEALLKRVDGLEKRLHDEGKAEGSTTADESSAVLDPLVTTSPILVTDANERQKSELTGNAATSPFHESPALLTPTESLYDSQARAFELEADPSSEPSLPNLQDIYLDTYFARVHGKPYHILDEQVVRQRCQTNQIPTFLLHAIYAVSAR
jgi:hypothetical protein